MGRGPALRSPLGKYAVRTRHVGTGGGTRRRGPGRELEEESGLTDVTTVAQLGPYALPERIQRGTNRLLRKIHPYVFESIAPVPDRWVHHATGSVEEEGVPFAFRWQRIPYLSVDPSFQEVVRRLQAWHAS